PAGVPGGELGQVGAAGPLRVHRRDPEDERRQGQEDRAARDVRRRARDRGVVDVIRTVWLDNPPVNAVDRGIIDTLWDAFESLDDDTHVVVLRGRGERAFSAGADIAGFVSADASSERPAGIQPVADLIERAAV